MGTTSSYGGSNKQSWDRSRDAIDEMGGGGAGADREPLPDLGDDDVAAVIWQEIADALVEEDPLLDRTIMPDHHVSIADLLPQRPRRQPRSGGEGGAGGVVRGTTSAPGRRGSGSKRTVVRGAARGGAAIGGAYAFLRGDAAGLAELGLDLASLRALSPRMQCARLLDAIVGQGGHPDDAALRRAAAETLKAVILDGARPEPVDALRQFSARYVFELCLVEIQRNINAGTLDSSGASREERRLWDFLESRMRLIDFPHDGNLSIEWFKETAMKLTRDTIRVLRAGREAR